MKKEDFVVAVIDDNIQFLEDVKRLFSKTDLEQKVTIKYYSDITKFEAEFNRNFQVIIADYYLDKPKDITAKNVVKKVLQVNPDCILIIISAATKDELFISDMVNKKFGIDFIYKMSTVFNDALVKAVKEAIDTRKQKIEYFKTLAESLK